MDRFGAAAAVLLIFLLRSTVAQGDFYDGCGTEKGCIGMPEGCTEPTSRDCSIALSYMGLSRDQYQLEIMGTDTVFEYLAAALSPNDAYMGEDSVMACIRDNDRVDMYWNYQGEPYDHQNVKLTDPSQGITDVSISQSDGIIRCQFKRDSFINITEGGKKGVFDMNAQHYHILFARGLVDPADDQTIQYHDYFDRFGTNNQYYLGEFNQYLGEQKIYNGCDEDKGCIGFPAGCVDTKNCAMMMTYAGIAEQLYLFELQGLEDQYVAFGLSNDTSMGSDSVIACTDTGVQRYWNTDKANLLADPEVGLYDAISRREGQYLFCSVVSDAVINLALPPEAGGGRFLQDLNQDMYNILLAKGPVEDGVIVKHNNASNATSDLISLARFNNFLNNVYDECGESKGCFGMPADCIDRYACDILSTYSASEDGSVNFVLYNFGEVPIDHYVAIGLSQDSVMGDDSVVVCSLEGFVDFNLTMTWNEDHDQSLALEDPRQGIIGIPEFSNENGIFSCSFTRQKETVIPIPGEPGANVTFNLAEEKYFLLLATGAMSNHVVQRHSARLASGAPVDLGSIEAVRAATTPAAIKWHGCLMVTAWYLLGSAGIFTARYCKKQFGGRKLFGKDFWFPVHQCCMSLTWLLTITAFIILIAEYQFSPLKWDAVQTNPHAVLGLVAFSLMFIQPFMALMRCHPGTKYRPLFNWLHFSVGMSAMILAMVAIFFATQSTMGPIKMKVGSEGIAIAYMAFFAAWHLLLTGYSYLKGEDHDRSEEKKEPPVDHIVTFGMVTYMVGAFGLTVAMIVMIASS